jgi:hypothetical protein
MVSLHEAYECNINSLGGICTPIGDGAPSADDYLRWLKSEVDVLPEVFFGVNENIVSVTLEGVLYMFSLEGHFRVRDDHLSLCPPCDVKKTLGKVANDWWHPFGYKEAFSVARTKLREVN